NESLNKQSQIEEVVFLALRQLKNSNLSHCLSEFAKRKDNLSDLLQLNSTVFFHYFNKTISSDSSNNILLTLMYLFELIFDAEILRIEIFELFLNLELKRVISNVHESSKVSFNSFLSMISNCSADLKHYLVKNFRLYLNFQSQFENTIKDEYFAVIIKWMNKNLNCYNTDDFLIELYKYIITFPDVKQFPLVYKFDYLSDLTPNYIGIAGDISSSNWNEFRDAIQRSFFGEEKYKRELYLCYKKNPSSSEALIDHYAKFGVLTTELVEMCEGYTDYAFFGIEQGPNLSNLKVFDRNVID
ncbi:unnamed protein product, partial [Rotaria sordida]